MTKLTAARSEQAQERYIARADSFWDQTVAENNARLNNKTMPDDVRDEIKFIQSVLLTKMNEQRE